MSLNRKYSLTASIVLSTHLGMGTALAESPAPEQLYTQLCGTCHVMQGPPTAAPPIFAVKAHVIEVYPGRDEFVNYVVQWVNTPDAGKTLMPGAVRRFGVMPKLGYEPAAVRQIAEYLYDTSLQEPPWFRSHFEVEHGRPPGR